MSKWYAAGELTCSIFKNVRVACFGRNEKKTNGYAIFFNFYKEQNVEQNTVLL